MKLTTGQRTPRQLIRETGTAATTVLVAVVCWGCTGGAPAPGNDILVDRAAAAGLDHYYFNGMSGQLFLCEIMAPGVALLDYDNDGDLDAFVVQGHMLDPALTSEQATVPPPPDALPLSDRLYRNELESAAGSFETLRFVDVTADSGLLGLGYSMGAATGDFDGDGWIDLYVTSFGVNQLWRNNGDGTFSDVAAAAGAADDRWSTSAAFFDYDRDGWLDLYVANYVAYSVAINAECSGQSGALDYCAPLVYEAQADRLLRNRGDGTYEDVSASAGIGRRRANGLGVVTADFDGDGWPDLYVANDLMQNILWHNQGDGTFVDLALAAGCAVDSEGNAQSSMGVTTGDFDNDGDEDLFVGHMARQTSTMYENRGEAGFLDVTTSSSLGTLSAPITTYGTMLFDYDNDGWLDLLVANGSMVNVDSQVAAGKPYPLLEPNQLYRNQADGTFTDVSHQAKALQQPEVSRGLAVGDVDNDGDLDALIGNSNGRARLLLNQVGQRAHWLGLRLVGSMVARDMLGARVEVTRGDGLVLSRRVRSDGSYLSASDPRLLLGLGDDAQPLTVQVEWPGGEGESWPALATDRYHTLVKGSGQALAKTTPPPAPG